MADVSGGQSMLNDQFIDPVDAAFRSAFLPEHLSFGFEGFETIRHEVHGLRSVNITGVDEAGKEVSHAVLQRGSLRSVLSAIDAVTENGVSAAKFGKDSDTYVDPRTAVQWLRKRQNRETQIIRGRRQLVRQLQQIGVSGGVSSAEEGGNKDEKKGDKTNPEPSTKTLDALNNYGQGESMPRDGAGNADQQPNSGTQGGSGEQTPGTGSSSDTLNSLNQNSAHPNEAATRTGARIYNAPPSVPGGTTLPPRSGGARIYDAPSQPASPVTNERNGGAKIYNAPEIPQNQTQQAQSSQTLSQLNQPQSTITPVNPSAPVSTGFSGMETPLEAAGGGSPPITGGGAYGGGNGVGEEPSSDTQSDKETNKRSIPGSGYLKRRLLSKIAVPIRGAIMGALRGIAAFLGSNPIGWVILFVLIIILLVWLVIASQSASVGALENSVQEAIQTGNINQLASGKVDASKPVGVELDDVGNIIAINVTYSFKTLPGNFNKVFSNIDPAKKVSFTDFKMDSKFSLPTEWDYNLTVNNSGSDTQGGYNLGPGTLSWVPKCSTVDCSNDYFLNITIRAKDPTKNFGAKEAVSSLKFDFQTSFKINYNGKSSTVNLPDPRATVCISPKLSTKEITVQGECGVATTNPGNTSGNPYTPGNGTLSSDFQCPLALDKSKNDKGYVTQGYNSAHFANDITTLRNGGSYRTGPVVAPIGGIITYVDNSKSVSKCGTAVIIQELADKTNYNPGDNPAKGPNSYYLGHIMNLPSDIANGTVKVVRQGDPLGTFFDGPLVDSCAVQNSQGGVSYIPCNKFVDGNMAGQMCWTGPHVHIEHRVNGSNVPDTISDLVQNKCIKN